MSVSRLQNTYKERHRDFSAQLSAITRRINIISNLRLTAAVLGILSFYFSLTNVSIAGITVGLLVIFFYLVQSHARLFREKIHLENLVRINKGEMNALSGNFSSFTPGNEFVDPHHPYTHDLDIFGDGSLYQYINRCNTINGRKNLAQHLENPLNAQKSIQRQQDAIRDLSTRIDLRQHLQAAGMEMGEQPADHQQLLRWSLQPPVFQKMRLISLLLMTIPPLTVLCLIATLYVPQAKLALMFLIIVQWIITASNLRQINVFHDYISRKKSILQKYSRLLQYIENEKFSSTKLQEISGQAREAHAKVGQLASLVSALDARTNSMTTLVVNSLLLYDLQCVYRLERWREENAGKLSVWLDAITEVECVSSLATFAYNHPDFKFATIHSEIRISATRMTHPLIPEAERVYNDMAIGSNDSVMIITGANMAGKSTFLRTLGVNMVLALNGAPVCASEFFCPLIEIRSGMRTADSLKDHQSYFYAELNRLKGIMDELRTDKPLLILLDEILKGTNSNDKQAGSISLVRQLLPHPCLALIATHDLALGDLEKEYPDRIKNYCFEATITDDQLFFDYKLKQGVAKNMNASFLMKKMGIIPK